MNSLRTSAALVIFIFVSMLAGQETGARYLVITHDNFYSAVGPFAQWKHRTGFRTKVVRLSEIGSNQTAIKSYITGAYNNWQIKPEYLLLVGAPNFIPLPRISNVYTDNFYTNMDADIYNEILSGRLTVHSTTEAQTVVAKMLKYERTPSITPDSLWFRKACLIVNEDNDWSGDDTIYWNDVNLVASRMVAGGYIQIDTLCDNYGDNAADVVDAANQGRDFVLYRGSGTNNWYWPFEVNPDGLANGSKLPIVVSATCGTLGTGSTPATAEKWFLTGTPTVMRGASGYFATTTSGYNLARYRSRVVRGFFDGIFVDHLWTFGAACENGRKRVYQTYGNTSEYYGFTTIGDPAMNIWTSTPRYVTVVHPATVPLGTNNIIVNVKANGQPIAGALVCAVQQDTVIYQTALTDAAGNAPLVFTANLPDTIYLTVTGHAINPYEGYILVVQAVEDGGHASGPGGFGLKVSPNPCRGCLDITWDNRTPINKIAVYEAGGRLVAECRDEPAIRSGSIRITAVADRTGGASTGVYFVRIEGNAGAAVEKIVILK